MIHKIRNLRDKPIVSYFIANVVYSMSSFALTLLLPIALDLETFHRFIYAYQMVLFLTTVTNIGIVVGLYKYIKDNRQEALGIYYSLLLIVYVLMLALACTNRNIVNEWIKIGPLTRVENFAFYLSLMVSSMFVYNKGKNVADKDYRYMLRVTSSASAFRLLAIVIAYIFQIKSITILLLLVFVFPFGVDVKDFIKNAYHYVRPSTLNKPFVKVFIYYSLRVWLIGTLFMVSDKMFLISTKGLNVQMTTAIAFAGGFLGIISLFNQTFQNYFISNLAGSDAQSIVAYIKKIRKLLFPYLLSLLTICGLISGFVFCAYPSLGTLAAIVVFATLIRAGLISYLGLYSLLTKILNLLNVEITLSVLRIAVVYCLCNFWHCENMLLWYVAVIFIIPFPEVILSVLVRNKALTASR